MTKYLAAMKALRDNTSSDGTPDPKLSADNYRHKEHKLTLFAEHFGNQTLDAVAGAEIEAWIEGFDEVESDVTFDNYVKHVSAMYGYFIGRKVVSTNPTEDVTRRSEFAGADGKIISPSQTAQLFHTALTFERNGQKIFLPMVGRLALEAFVGFRFSSACRVSKEDINFADRGILLPKKKLKTGLAGGGRHYIDNLPAQIWDWLEIAPAKTWVLSAREYMGLKSMLFRTATVPNPGNCLRHGFCSYDIAAHKNPGRTAVILCHKDQDLLWKHYYGVKTFGGVLVTTEMGKVYQSITPTTAARVAEGFEPFRWQDSSRTLRPSESATPGSAQARLPA